MATKGERQALLFLAAIALLGAGTRAWRARNPPRNPGAIEAQIAAVDSSRTSPVSRTRGKKPSRKKPPPAASEPLGRIDLDLASSEEIERLPGIGPALAGRIVGERQANGAYGCLVALDAVKGIGPAMLKRLDSLTAFSGAPRQECFKAGGGRVPP